jgi:hypothetical protein
VELGAEETMLGIVGLIGTRLAFWQHILQVAQSEIRTTMFRVIVFSQRS